MADDTIEIEYQLTADDVIKFSLNFWSPKKSQTDVVEVSKLKKVGKIILWGVACTIYSFAITGGLREDGFNNVFDSVWDYIIFILLFCSMMLIFLPTDSWVKKITKRKMMKKIHSEKNGNLFSPVKMQINSSEISVYQKYANLTFKWQGLEKIELEYGDLCIYVSSLNAMAIPSRFFESEDEKQRIFEQCKTWFLDAQEPQKETVNA
tara:strand:- start:4457 stop:5077 length:621 start_codon:yes stop_codon:yes gene_type:complete